MKLQQKDLKKTKFLTIIYVIAILGFSLMMVVVFLNQDFFGQAALPVFLMSFLLMAVFLLSGAIRTRRNLVEPIAKLTEQTQQMAAGDHELHIESHLENEVKDLIISVNNINSYIKNARDFVRKIENGDLEAQYQGMEDENNMNPESLIFALLSMRRQIKQFSEQENQQKWATQGLANFIEILRQNQTNLKALYDKIISELVKYTGANQGAMFLLHDFAETQEGTYLEMVTCYAYDRLKFMTKKVEFGEGLVGQSWQEKDILYYTEIPENYANITSGLGGAPPRSILIVPLMINQNVYGILELASFDEFPEYKREFVAKLGENIASTITNLKNVEQTKRLLRESQEQSEQMRAQEEEMRQNVEELTATQEEMRRKQEELEKANQKMQKNEIILQKAFERSAQKEKELKQKTDELEAFNQKMKENEQILQNAIKEASKNELELLSKAKELEDNMLKIKEIQKEMEAQKHELHLANKKMKANEDILQKAFKQAQQKEAEIKKQNAELQENKILLEAKTNEMEEINKRLKDNESVLVKAVQGMKAKDKKYVEQLKTLQEEINQLQTENEQLKSSRTRRSSSGQSIS